MTRSLGRLKQLPRVDLAHVPTPIDELKNLCQHVGGIKLFVKRDDCTGLAFGGNKVRQLEFYLGEAQAQSADTVLITGAVQSNFVRLAAAAACKLGMKCCIQLEDRVADVDSVYKNSGNVLLDRLFGAKLYYYDKGEDEAGADRRIREIAGELEEKGRRTYVIPLAPGHPPLGALGYVLCAQELLQQMNGANLDFAETVTASGSGHTHAGLLFGLKALGSDMKVTGICVRRDADAQQQRIESRCHEIAQLLGITNPVARSDINLVDAFLAPGYGMSNPAAMEAIELSAHLEGLLVDPTYTAKSMAGFIAIARQHKADSKRAMLFMHTGGQPAIFGYESKLTRYLLNPDEIAY